MVKRNEMATRVGALNATIAAKAAERATLAESLTALQARFQALSTLRIWAEAETGETIPLGERMRYLGHTYECILAHEKALTRRPSNPQYWKEAEV